MIHGVGAQIWDMANGRVFASLWDERISKDQKIAASFVPHAEENQPNSADLWLLNSTSSQATQTSLHLPKLPSWFGLSATGEAVVYEIPPTTHVHEDGSSQTLRDGKIQIFSNGAIRDIPCAWRNGRDIKASIDPSGTIFSAVCDSPDGAGFNGTTAKYWTLWRLPALQEMASIPVQNSLMNTSVSPDQTTGVLCYSNKLQVVNLTTKTVIDIPTAFTDRGDIGNCQIQGDNHTIVLTVRGPAAYKVEWVDISDNSKKSSIPLAPIFALTTNLRGYAAVLTNDGIVSVFDPAGVRRARLLPISSKDWLAFSDTGFFDGTANAIQWASYRLSASSPLVPVTTLFNDLYTPGLLPLLIAGQTPHLPDGISLGTLLELPDSRTLLQNPGTTAVVLDGHAVVCIGQADVFQAIAKRFGESTSIVRADQTHPNCQNRIVLSDQANPQRTVTALQALKSSRFITPWDNQKISPTGSRVYGALFATPCHIKTHNRVRTVSP